jgi:hypothetical protein
MSKLASKAAAFAVLACLLPFAGEAAPPPGGIPGQDPNWPCQQRLVPSLNGASLWSQPMPADLGDWHNEAKAADLVNRIAPRSVSTEEGTAAIEAFVKELADQDRVRLVALAFTGLVEETNRERSEIIDRLKDFGQRQRNLSDLISRLTAEHDAIAIDAKGDDAARKLDLEQRLVYTTRAFQGLQSTIRYACEAPGQLEARLGAYAHALQPAK